MKNKIKTNIIISLLCCMALLLGACANKEATKTVLRINGSDITQTEYDYYYYSYYKMYVDDFSAFFEYMGVDVNEDLETQVYEDGKTFGELFEECTLDQIKQVYCLYDDGHKNGFEYDANKEYEDYKNLVLESLKNSKYTLDDYYKNYYGKYASEDTISEYLKMGFYANAYYNYLVENTSTDEAYNYVKSLKDQCEVEYEQE